MFPWIRPKIGWFMHRGRKSESCSTPSRWALAVAWRPSVWTRGCPCKGGAESSVKDLWGRRPKMTEFHDSWYLKFLPVCLCLGGCCLLLLLLLLFYHHHHHHDVSIVCFGLFLFIFLRAQDCLEFTVKRRIHLPLPPNTRNRGKWCWGLNPGLPSCTLPTEWHPTCLPTLNRLGFGIRRKNQNRF